MSYPTNCVRGIPNTSYINSDGTIGSHLFYFDYRDDRADGWGELSINWQDDDAVIACTLAQRKPNGDLQFMGGAVVIPKTEIDRLNSRPTVQGLLSYERMPLPDNPYHGNILLRPKTSKQTMRTISAGLALAVVTVVKS